jgi:hypothetical protein
VAIAKESERRLQTRVETRVRELTPSSLRNCTLRFMKTFCVEGGVGPVWLYTNQTTGRRAAQR